MPNNIFYYDEEGNEYKDCDPCGVDMSGKRHIIGTGKMRQPQPTPNIQEPKKSAEDIYREMLKKHGFIEKGKAYFKTAQVLEAMEAYAAQWKETSSPVVQPTVWEMRERAKQNGFDDYCEAHDLPYNDECPECARIETRQMASEAGMSQEDFDRQTKQGEIPEEIKDWIKENKPKVDVGLDPEDYASEVGEQRGWAKGAIAMYHKMQEEIKQYRKALDDWRKFDPQIHSLSGFAQETKELLSKYPQLLT